MRADVGTVIPLASRPFNDASLDMGRPPQTSLAYSRTGRAALAAGTLGTVGDHPPGEDVHRNVEMRDANRYDPNVMHDSRFSPADSASRKGRSRGDAAATSAVMERPEARIGQERAVLPQKPGTAGGDGPSCITPSAVTAESLRQARLLRWQTIR